VVSHTTGTVNASYMGDTVTVPADSAAAEQERQLPAAAAPIPTSTAPFVTRPIAISAPRPDYPYEARARHITGAGVALFTIEPSSGNVTDVSMAQSTGSPILDNAIVSACRRWRFKPGSYDPHFKLPISYTMTGATY
jgi:periplasmic protein TonB